MNEQQIRHRLACMPLDTYTEIEDATCARVSKTHYMVMRGGTIEHFGGRNWSVPLTLARVIEAITHKPQPRPCGHCGKPTETRKSYCNACATKATLKSRMQKATSREMERTDR